MSKYDSRGYFLAGDTMACRKCGRQTDIALLDAKDDGTGNFTLLECQRCYGEGWLPIATRTVSPDVRLR